MTASEAIAQHAKTSGFRKFRLVGKRPESSVISSFLLEPLDPSDFVPFKPGQYLVFKVSGPDGHTLHRQYSVSSSPRSEGRYRVTIKREAAPSPELPNGVGSCYFHDTLAVGAVVEAQLPRGDFVLKRDSERPVVLLSGGVGLTPMLSMLDVLVHETRRRVSYIHGCLNGDVHAMHGEVKALASLRTGIDVHSVYQAPTANDLERRCFDAEGFVTRELLQRWLPLDDYDFYLCGPPAFMAAVYGIVRSLGVPKDRIAYEFFGPATVLEPDTIVPVVVLPAKESVGLAEATVTLSKSGRTLAWESTDKSLLECLERHGLSPEFSCRAGICNTCKVSLSEGEVSYFEEPLDKPPLGEVLLCCSKPVGPISLEL